MARMSPCHSRRRAERWRCGFDSRPAHFMPVRITYFVHGTTKDNENDIATGWKPGELSSLGTRQAKDLGKLVKASDFSAIFSSDLKRAVDSARLAFPEMKITIDRRLREADYGDLTGKPCSEFKSRLEEFVEKPFPGGESFKQVEMRISSFLETISVYEGKRIAVVAHQAPQLALEVLLNKKTWKQAIAGDWRRRKAWQPGWEYSLRPKST